MGSDLAFAVRLLRKNPGFTAAAVITLALGIALNTTVFTMVNGTLLRALPFEDAERVVHITTRRVVNGRIQRAGVSYPDFGDWQRASRTFEALGVFSERPMNLVDETITAARFRGSYVSVNAFGLLGERVALGRDFRPDDDRPGAAPVVILGHEIWRSRYAGDASVIGRTIRVNNVPSTVIGVMRERFGFPRNAQLWQPLARLPSETLTARDVRPLTAFGRLKDGVSIVQARDDLERAAAALSSRFPDSNAGVEPVVAGYRDGMSGTAPQRVAWVAMAAVGLVLLMACANVANLLLARAVTRSREMSVRMSMGAGRGRIVRQLLVESVLLAGVSGAVGFWLSLATVRVWTGSFVGPEANYWFDFSPDARVLGFFALLTLGTPAVFGMLPALHTARSSMPETLNAGARGSGAVRGRRWMGTLVAAQLALAIVLLASAGLMVRDAVALVRTDAGVDTAAVTLARLSLPVPAYPTQEARNAFFRRLDERLSGLPSTRATFASDWPRGGAEGRDVSIAGREPRDGVVSSFVTIGPHYFESLGVAPVRGSTFDGGQSDAAIVNERFAALYFPDDEPIGRQIRIEASSDGPASEWLTIVGVAPNIRQRRAGPDRAFDPIAYVPYTARPVPWAMLLIRSDAGHAVAASLVREAVADVDPDLPLFDVMPLDDKLAEDRSESREQSAMFGGLAVIAVMLAAVGLSGVTAYVVSQRTREIGIRIALGARPSHIWRMVAGSAAVQVGTGLGAGIAGAIAAGRVVQGMLEQTRGNDVVTLVAVPLFLSLVALLACVAPSRRAMRIEPVATLKSE